MNHADDVFDRSVTRVLRSPAPRPEFVARLLATLALQASQRLAVLPESDDPARRGRVLVGTVAGATAAGIVLIGWRMSRRGVA